MKKMTTIMAIMMGAVMSLTACGQEQISGNDELAVYFHNDFDREFKEDVIEEFGETYLDNDDVVIVTKCFNDCNDEDTYEYIGRVYCKGFVMKEYIYYADFDECETFKDINDNKCDLTLVMTSGMQSNDSYKEALSVHEDI